jgi:hypothetical protein
MNFCLNVKTKNMNKILLALLTLLHSHFCFSQTTDLKEQIQKGEEAFAEMVANQTYLVGLPVVLNYQFVNRMKLIDAATKTGQSKIKLGNTEGGLQANKWIHVLGLPDHDSKSGAAPNDDTHYSVMFADLTKEPLILTVPAIKDRYFSITMTDAYNENLHYVTTRLGDTEGGSFALVGPNFSGKIPKKIKKTFRFPHNFIHFVSRVEVNGKKEDTEKAAALQMQFRAESLSKFTGKVKEDAKIDLPTVPKITNALEWFAYMLKCMQQDPPIARDAHFLKQMELIGLKIDGSTDVNALSPIVKKALEKAYLTGQNMVQWYRIKGGDPIKKGWVTLYDRGVPEHNYLLRAQYSQTGLNGHTKEEALYVRGNLDEEGGLLDGKNSYVLTIPKDKLPPVGCFWSIITYDNNNDFVKNAQYHYSVGERKAFPLKRNADGSITIYCQNDPPNGELSNWLPTPKEGGFYIVYRMYCPDPKVFDPKVMATYLPAIEKVK